MKKSKMFSIRGANYSFAAGMWSPLQISYRNVRAKPIGKNKTISFRFILKGGIT